MPDASGSSSADGRPASRAHYVSRAPYARGAGDAHGATRRKLERLRTAMHSTLVRCAMADWLAAASSSDAACHSADGPQDDARGLRSSPGGRKTVNSMKLLRSVSRSPPERFAAGSHTGLT